MTPEPSTLRPAAHLFVRAGCDCEPCRTAAPSPVTWETWEAVDEYDECDEWHPGVALDNGECPECAAAFDRARATR